MRYLWVEDFNDESSTDTDEELKERLIDFFDLHNDKIIVKRTLSSAIEFLENTENFDEIDAVLIDIRFPEGDNSELYPRYFGSIVTPKFYSDNVEDASGILLYLLLVFRYHLSQEKMAFISANISSNNSKLKTIQEMIEIIVKSKYTSLSEEDKMSYRTSERELGKEILKVSQKEKEWDTFILKDNRQVEGIDLDKLLKQIRRLPLQYYDKFQNENDSSKSDEMRSAQVKYNAVKDQFDQIGFVMPAAFEKPKIGESKDKRYVFMQWKTELHMDPYNVIRSNIQEMCIILIDYLNHSRAANKLYSCFLKLLTCDPEEQKYYDDSFFIRYLKNLKGIFAIECSESIEVHCERALKEITALWEASAKPKYKASNYLSNKSDTVQDGCYEHEDHCQYACHATLKIVRNWLGHQGIKNVDNIDVGLIFLLNMRGIFDIHNLPEDYIDKYKKCEDDILEMYQLDEDVMVETEESLEYFYDLNNITKKGKNSSRDIYDKISGLGHSQSKVRRDISMDEIYMLLYHILDQDCDDIFIEIKKRIKARTWKNWRERYNKRFGYLLRC